MCRTQTKSNFQNVYRLRLNYANKVKKWLKTFNSLNDSNT